MSTANGQAAGQTEKTAPEVRSDFYDPHFPARQRVKDKSDPARNETFDPHFPALKRH